VRQKKANCATDYVIFLKVNLNLVFLLGGIRRRKNTPTDIDNMKNALLTKKKYKLQSHLAMVPSSFS